MNPTVEAALIGLGGTAVGGFWLLVGQSSGARRDRKARERAAAAESRAALGPMADELVESVLGLLVAGRIHDHLWAGWGPRLRSVMVTLASGGIGFGTSEREGLKRLWDAYDRAIVPAQELDRAATQSAEKLAAPLSRLCAALPPLMRRPEEDVRAAAGELFEAATKHSQGGPEVERALSAFTVAVREAVRPPAPEPRRLRTLGLRRARALSPVPASTD